MSSTVFGDINPGSSLAANAAVSAMQLASQQFNLSYLGLVVTLAGGKFAVAGGVVVEVTTFTATLTANSTSLISVNASGVISVVTTLPAGSFSLWSITTDGTKVISVTDLRLASYPFPSTAAFLTKGGVDYLTGDVVSAGAQASASASAAATSATNAAASATTSSNLLAQTTTAANSASASALSATNSATAASTSATNSASSATASAASATSAAASAAAAAAATAGTIVLTRTLTLAGGTYTLSTVEAATPHLILTGATATTVVFPQNSGKWLVENRTGGSPTLSLAGTAATIPSVDALGNNCLEVFTTNTSFVQIAASMVAGGAGYSPSLLQITNTGGTYALSQQDETAGQIYITGGSGTMTLVLRSGAFREHVIANNSSGLVQLVDDRNGALVYATLLPTTTSIVASLPIGIRVLSQLGIGDNAQLPQKSPALGYGLSSTSLTWTLTDDQNLYRVVEFFGFPAANTVIRVGNNQPPTVYDNQTSQTLSVNTLTSSAAAISVFPNTRVMMYASNGVIEEIARSTAAGAASVTNVSVVTANGVTGSVANATTTPAITLGTSVTGLVKGSAGALVAATAGADYLTPTGNGAALTGITVGQVAGAGTVTSASVATANGFAGSVATSTSTPAVTLTTTVTGLVKGSAGALVAASAGTDYLTPAGSGAALTGITASQVGAPSGSGSSTGTNTGDVVISGVGVTNGLSVTGQQISLIAASATSTGSLTSSDWGVFNGKAPLASPTFTGTPAAPTASIGTNTTQLATTAFAQALHSNGEVVVSGTTASVTPDCSTTDVVTVTSTAATFTIANAINVPAAPRVLLFYFPAQATAKALAWGTNYAASSVSSLPSITVATVDMRVYFIRDTQANVFDMVGKPL